MRRIVPALVLLGLSPVIGEFLLGNLPISTFPAVLFMIPMYGCGALLIREFARRTGRGWPTIMLLGLAYGVIEEGLADLSLFNPHFQGLDLLSYGHAAGLGWPWTLYVLALHTGWSICVPIALTEALFRSREPWLRTFGFSVTAVVYVLGCVAVHFAIRAVDSFEITLAQAIGSAVAVLAIIAVAVMVPARRETVPGRATAGPWLVGAATFLLTTVGLGVWALAPDLHLPAWVTITVQVLCYLAALSAIWLWSASPDWSSVHVTAVATGALLTYCWMGFLVIGPGRTVDTIGQGVISLMAIGFAAWCLKRANTVATSVTS
jgi:hypothetical protein